MVDAVAPVVVLIGLLALTMVLFGTEAADGPFRVDRREQTTPIEVEEVVEDVVTLTDDASAKEPTP